MSRSARRLGARVVPANLAEHRERRPIVVRGDGQAAEAFRHHADDLERKSINDQAVADDARVAREQPVPAAVAEDNHGLSPTRLVVGGGQRSPHRSADTDDLEEVARDEGAEHQAPVDTAFELGPLRVRVGEDAGLLAERVELWPGKKDRSAVGGSLSLHDEHFMHVRHAVHVEQQRVHNREGHGGQAEPERHGANDGEGDEGRAPERAQGKGNVPHRVVQKRHAARVAALVGGQRHGAEARPGPCPRLRLGHASGDELLCLAFDVEGQLVAELTFDATRREQCTHAQAPVPEAHRVRPAS